MDLKPVRGTRDFPPEDMRLRTWLFGHFRAVAQLFAFEEYDAPILESGTPDAQAEDHRATHNFRETDRLGACDRLDLFCHLLFQRVHFRRGSMLSIPQCWRYERMQREGVCVSTTSGT